MDGSLVYWGLYDVCMLSVFATLFQYIGETKALNIWTLRSSGRQTTLPTTHLRLIPSMEETYPAWEKEKSCSKVAWLGDMLVPSRVSINIWKVRILSRCMYIFTIGDRACVFSVKNKQSCWISTNGSFFPVAFLAQSWPPRKWTSVFFRPLWNTNVMFI